MAPSSPVRLCPACGAEVPAGDRFCNTCGKPVPEVRACAKCGATLTELEKFCEQCGEPVAPPAPVPVTPSPPPPPPSQAAPPSPPTAPAGKPKWIIGILMAVMVVLAIGAFTVAGPMLQAGGGSGGTPTPIPTSIAIPTLPATATATITPTRTATVTQSPTAGAPSADFTAVPLSGQVPLSVQFTDRSGGNPASWIWDFGDGGTSTLANPSHTYTFAGTFGVRLTVQGSGGSDTEYRQELVTVTEKVQAPGAAFTVSSTSGTAPLSVQFTDRSTGSPTLWTWTFGDGSTSSLRNPAHTYAGTGTYKVEMTVSNGGGTDSASETITVTAPSTTAPPTTTAPPVTTTTSPPVTTTVAPPLTGYFTGGWTTWIGANPPSTTLFNPPLDSSVTGTMGPEGMSTWELTGTLSGDGRTLEGTWDEILGTDTGTFRFVLGTGDTTFSGIWVEDGYTFPATGEAQLI